MKDKVIATNIDSKHEYDIWKVNLSLAQEEETAFLNRRGAEGWTLCYISGDKYYFSRLRSQSQDTSFVEGD